MTSQNRLLQSLRMDRRIHLRELEHVLALVAGGRMVVRRSGQAIVGMESSVANFELSAKHVLGNPVPGAE